MNGDEHTEELIIENDEYVNKDDETIEGEQDIPVDVKEQRP